MLIDVNPGDIFEAVTTYRLADGELLRFTQPVIVWAQDVTDSTASALISYSTDAGKIDTDRAAQGFWVHQPRNVPGEDSWARDDANIASVRIIKYAGRSYRPNDPGANSAPIMADAYRKHAASVSGAEDAVSVTARKAKGLQDAAKNAVAVRDATIRAAVAGGRTMYWAAKQAGVSQQRVARIVGD